MRFELLWKVCNQITFTFQKGVQKLPIKKWSLFFQNFSSWFTIQFQLFYQAFPFGGRGNIDGSFRKQFCPTCTTKPMLKVRGWKLTKYYFLFYILFMPCPSIGSKWFWTVQIVLDGQVQIILDRFNFHFYWLLFMIWTCPKWFGRSKMIWTGCIHFVNSWLLLCQLL